MTGSPIHDFEYEVFISYAHLDNRPLLGNRGWITQFDLVLDNLLSQYLGSEARIWRDNMLRGNDRVTNTIHIQLPRVAIMISILSPRYIHSDWCLWEVDAFCKAAEESGGYFIGNKSRIYKVIKTPLRMGKPPSVFRDLKGYEFFRIEDRNGPPRQFDVEYDDDRKRDFLDSVGDIAYDIANLLEIIRISKMAGGSASMPNPMELSARAAHPTSIYLAEATPDLARERDMIKRDLLERKYSVLPENPLPNDFNGLQEMVRQDLERCCLSIHLVGQDYGDSPKGDNRSCAYWQHLLAEERLADPGFSRLIWMPKKNKPSDDRQEAFVKELLNADSPINTDLLLTSLEDFKTAIQDKLKVSLGNASEPGESNDAQRIYIICDKLDFESVRPLERYFRALGYEPVLPVDSDDEAQLHKDHEAKLQQCSAVVIYWNTAPRLWLLTMLEDVQNVRIQDRTIEIASKAIFICGDKTPEKDRFQANDSFVIKHFGEITLPVLEARLQPFISEVESYREGQDNGNF